MNSERELFEEECKILKYNGDMTRSNIGNFYIDDQTNWMYQMWLSSKNREGYKFVPVEPTYEMIENAIGYDGHIESIYKAMIGAVE